ncbi:MAG: hypothetical protein JWM31_1570, partial [Solirubrobacterales bacterium]|nr:hypothetical protein [Solirubrobacterales bacterium]
PPPVASRAASARPGAALACAPMAVRRKQVRSTVRIGPKVEHAQHDDVLSALLALRERLDGIGATRGSTSVFRRELPPSAQVAARGEVRGSGVAAGIDVRGDGTAEAWTGRWRREVVARQPGEDAFAALARVLRGPG